MICRTSLLVLIGLFGIVACNPTPVLVEDLPVVEVRLNGHSASAPYYEFREPLTEYHHEIDTKMIRDISDIVKSMTRDALGGGKGMYETSKRVVKFIKHGKHLVEACIKNKAKLDELRKVDKRIDAPVKPGYMAEMSMLIQEAINHDVCSKKVVPLADQLDWCNAKKLSSDLSQQHTDLIANYMDLLVKLIEKSPVGIYLNYKKSTIDDEPVVEVFGREVAFFRKNGYSAVVKILGLLASALKIM